MSIVTEISRLQTAANTIKTKCVELGLEKTSADGSGDVASSDTLDVHARALDEITKISSVSVITDPSGSVTIPAGYSDGSVSVAASVPVNYYYTGETDPSSSLGSNGDIYLKLG